MRKEFEMSEGQLNTLLDACKPTPAIYVSGGTPAFGTPQENANRAWRSLGEEMGFDWETVSPSNKGDRFFFAEAHDAENDELTVDELRTKQDNE